MTAGTVTLCRRFATTASSWKNTIKLKGRSKSSQEWLIRQSKDPYVSKAKRENYRARSAYKLLEMQHRLSLLRPGDAVVECGAAPGAWSQVVVRAINADAADPAAPVGRLVGCDLHSVHPLEGATHIIGDFSAADTQQKLCALLGAQPTVVLSDMAPEACGIRQLDQDRIVQLCTGVARFGVKHLQPGGSILMKLWAGDGESRLRRSLAAFFETVRTVKPAASRSDSAEVYLLAMGFRGATQSAAEPT